MLQGLSYSRNGYDFVLTADGIVGDTGLTALNVTFPDGTQLAAGTKFEGYSSEQLTIASYSLNEAAFLDPSYAGLVKTVNMGAAITGIDASNLPSGTYIKDISYSGSTLKIEYHPYSPAQVRKPVEITVTVDGADIPVMISIDYDQPLQYYLRVVSNLVTTKNGGGQISNLNHPDEVSIKVGQDYYVEVWMQNENPIFGTMFWAQYNEYYQSTILEIYGSYLSEDNPELTITMGETLEGYSQASNWSGDSSLEMDADGFTLKEMSTLAMLESQIYGSKMDGHYARIGYFVIKASSTGSFTLTVSAAGGGGDNPGGTSTLALTSTTPNPDTPGEKLQYFEESNYDPSQVGYQKITIHAVNSLSIYGTQSARETVVDGSGVYMTVSKDKTAPAKVDALPANEQWLTEWDTYYVNLWVNTQDPNVNLESLLFDLAYNGKYITATGIEYTDAIAGLMASFNSADGTVTGIGGKLLAELTNEDGFILIGRVKMESLKGDNVPAATVGAVKTGLTLDNITLFDKSGESLTPNTRVYVNTNVYAVVYDINDDGKVDIYDLISFAKNYGDKSVDSLNPVTWALDFNNSGKIDIYDLIQFAKNYGARQGGNQTIVYPEGFMQRWIGSQFLTTGDASVAEMLDVVVRQWQDALGEQFQLDVQIIVREIGDSTLGETVLVSLDNAGKPAVAVIYLDASALGLGWYVGTDATQLADSGRYDLYTVLAHELGHALGFNPLYTGFIDTLDASKQSYTDDNGDRHVLMVGSDHLWDENDLMYYQIAPGVRKEISPLDAEIVAKARANGGELKQVQKIAILGESNVMEIELAVTDVTTITASVAVLDESAPAAVENAPISEASAFVSVENAPAAVVEVPVMTIAVASTVVDQAAWTQTLEEKVVADIQREAQLLTAAAMLAQDDDAPAITPAAEADSLEWLDLSAKAPIIAPLATAQTVAADLLLGEWENFLNDDDGGPDALDVTLDAE